MPVLAVGFDSAGGQYALAKFDNTTGGKQHQTGSWEKLVTSAAVATAQDPVSVAVSSDGSVFSVGYAASAAGAISGAADNASIVIFYDE